MTIMQEIHMLYIKATSYSYKVLRCDRQTVDKVIPLCHFASQETIKGGDRNSSTVTLGSASQSFLAQYSTVGVVIVDTLYTGGVACKEIYRDNIKQCK